MVIALGSNLGDRAWHLRRAIHELTRSVRLVRISAIHETDPVEAPAGSPDFLNMVVVGRTFLNPFALLDELLAIEARLGRRRSVRNAPRVIDLDLIFYGSRHIQTKSLIVPHPRWMERGFVLEPLREVWRSA